MPPMRIVLLAVLLVACGDNHATVDGAMGSNFEDAPADGPNPNNPQTLFETGLCVDHACNTISPDVHAYTPQFPLWADTATKRRWFYLPPGTQIDTSDMDHWQFPEGTKFWKEFTRDGVRVETRLVQKIGPGTGPLDWLYVSFQWNAANDDTTLASPQMGVMNANGTMHDIPSRSQCKQCHENFAPSRILGFGAIQLDATATGSETSLATLVAASTLTVNPPSPGSVGAPFYPIEGTTAEKAAMGYVHANCSHCHNASSAVHDIVPMELRLLVGEVHDHTLTAAYRTAVGKRATQPIGLTGGQLHCADMNGTPNAAECIIAPGVPDDSVMLLRFRAAPTTNLHMPQLGSEMMDPTGNTTLTTWATTP